MAALQAPERLAAAPAAPPTLPICVAICTYQRPASLVRALRSVAAQRPQPAQVLVVDGSRDDGTELAVAAYARDTGRAVEYVRVGDGERGLTRQRNRALREARAELVAFFDDDVVLLPGCLAELERAYREAGPGAVGVGALIEGERRRPPALWRLRHALGVVPHLRAGSYCGSGMSIPWAFLPAAGGPVRGDWLSGCAMLWRAEPARREGFDPALGGYAQGEDLEFSLRMGRHGAILLAPAARVRHLHAAEGRPDRYRLGRMEIYNRYQIHRRAFPARRHRAWFCYAWGLDTLLLARGLLAPGGPLPACRQIAGRLSGFAAILRGR